MVPTNWKAQCERQIRETIEGGQARGAHILLGVEERTKSLHQMRVRDKDVLTLLRAPRKHQFSRQRESEIASCTHILERARERQIELLEVEEHAR